MQLILIAALDADRYIGRDGDIPWHLPDDLRRFRRLTSGHTVLMGRRTWDSLGRPLPQRTNRVLTRDPGFAPAGAEVFRDLSHALQPPADGLLYVIGGAELYRETLAQADLLELTQVHAHIGGDTRFPEFAAADWSESAREDHPADERHAHAYSFLTLRRRRGPL